MVKKRMTKGSFTVELACLMPLILLVIFAGIYLCFYVHNRAWLTAAAYESALTGCGEREKAAGLAAARERGRTLANAGLFGAKNLQMEVSEKGDIIRVQFDEDTVSVYGGLAWHLQAAGEAERIDPVSFIWRAKGLGGLAESLTGNGGS